MFPYFFGCGLNVRLKCERIPLRTELRDRKKGKTSLSYVVVGKEAAEVNVLDFILESVGKPVMITIQTQMLDFFYRSVREIGSRVI